MEEIILNIKDFNAIGDGSTDNTQAFQNAINTIKITKTAKATIYVPEGIYKVKYIELRAGVTLRGDGMNSQIVLDENSKAEALISNTVETENGNEIDIHIKDLFLWGGFDYSINNNPSVIIDAIKLKGTYFSNVENCKIANFSGNGINMTQGNAYYNTNYIKDCIIYNNNKYGIFADGSGADFHVQGGDIGKNKEGNIILFSPSSSISNVKAIWGSTNGNGITVSGLNVQIVGNNIEGNAKCGIEVYSSNCFISSNKIYSNSASNINGSNENKYKFGAIEIVHNTNNPVTNTNILSNQILGDLYESSIKYGIRNSGLNTSIYSNSIFVDPSNGGVNNKNLQAVISSFPIESDFNWIKTNVLIKSKKDILVKPNTFQILELQEPSIDIENNIENNSFKAINEGLYTFKLKALINSPNINNIESSIKILDSKKNVYVLSKVEFGTIAFSADIYLKKDEAIYFSIESKNPATIVKEQFTLSVRKAIV